MKHTLMELFAVPEDLAAFKEEEPEKSKKLVNVPTLASIESLTFPLVKEVVVLADHRCKMSQDRVADIVSRLNGKCSLFQDFLIFRHSYIQITYIIFLPPPYGHALTAHIKH
ncbi:hypothetical protein Hanom_Chr15g01384871 [Helianthus anomalus]